jgi:XTP/dITP diphosphohydrolase
VQEGPTVDRHALRFLSSSRHKIAEATAMLAPAGIDVIPVAHKIEELQTQDTERLVRSKVLEAFGHIGRPLFVEHTGLYLDYLHGFPGGLTQLFWDTIGPERFTGLFGTTPDPRALARSVVGYTDGRTIHLFAGEIAGRIAPEPRGREGFSWDCVFIPDGQTATFAELGESKKDLSMRRRALDQFARFLRQARGS